MDDYIKNFVLSSFVIEERKALLIVHTICCITDVFFLIKFYHFAICLFYIIFFIAFFDFHKSR